MIAMSTREFQEQNLKFLKHYGISDIKEVANKKVAIVLQESFKNNINAQNNFILSSNMAIRLYANVDFIFSEGLTLMKEVESSEIKLQEYIKNIFNNILPEGNFNFLCSEVNIGTYDGVLVIGKGGYEDNNQIYSLSDGWNIYINNPSVISNNVNPIGACAAACFGVAELFKKVSNPKGNRKIDSLEFSLLNYSTELPIENPHLPTEINLGEVTLVGAGAIGSAFMYTINALNSLNGTLNIVDGDKYSESNLNRYIIADNRTVGMYKTDIAESIFKTHEALTVKKYPMVYDEFIINNSNIDTLISAVDKRVTRYNMQSDIPKLILDAATTESIIDLARIEFTKGACLGCLYKIKPEDNFILINMSKYLGLDLARVKYLFESSRGLNKEDIEVISKKLDKELSSSIDSPIDTLYAREYCGSGKLTDKETGEVVIAPISFISVLAGVFLAGELVKDRYFPLYKINNTFQINTFGRPVSQMHSYKNSDPKCFYCNDEVYKAVYKEKWNL